MEDLKDIVRLNLSKKKINQKLAIYFVLSLLKKRFNTDIKGVFKNGILYLKIHNPHIAFQIFVNKIKIIQELNEKLKKFGYSLKILDIRKR